MPQGTDDQFARYCAQTTTDRLQDRDYAIIDDLFTRATRKQLESALLSQDDAVAVRAAWERLVRSMRGHSSRVRFESARRDEVSRFIGFVEGRLKISPPSNWAKSILSVELEEPDGAAGFVFLDATYAAQRKVIYGNQITRLSNGVALKAEHVANWTSVSYNTGVSELELGLDRKLPPMPIVIARGFDEKVHLLISSSHPAAGYSLCKFDATGQASTRSTERVLTSPIIVLSDLAEHVVELKIQHEQLWVFGASHSAIYIERRQPGDYSVTFSFSSAF